MAHLLEHMIISESKGTHSSSPSLPDLISKTGGRFNAWTYDFFSEFMLELPEPIDLSIVKEFIQTIYFPKFNKTELTTQKNIIANERNLNKYYPGESELGQYLFTQWMYAGPVSKNQTFGTQKSLASITTKHLEEFHRLYRSTKGIVMIGGQVKNLDLTDELSAINTHSIQPIKKCDAVGWVDQLHQTKVFTEIDAPQLYWGGIGEITVKSLVGLRVLLSFLTDENSGVLNQWLRQDRGWSYGCFGTDWFDRNYLAGVITIPLNNTRQAITVKKEINDRVASAIKNKTGLKKHIEQMHREECFSFETLSDRMKSAAQELMDLGTIITEKQYQELLTEFQSPNKIREIYETYLHPDQSGQLLALPKT